MMFCGGLSMSLLCRATFKRNCREYINFGVREEPTGGTTPIDGDSEGEECESRWGCLAVELVRRLSAMAVASWRTALAGIGGGAAPPPREATRVSNGLDIDRDVCACAE